MELLVIVPMAIVIVAGLAGLVAGWIRPPDQLTRRQAVALLAVLLGVLAGLTAVGETRGDESSWDRLPDWDDPAEHWPVVETASEALDATFEDGSRIEQAADDYAEASSWERLDEDSFTAQAVDWDTVTVLPPTWPGPRSPPFYASVVATIVAGPDASSACGIGFDFVPNEENTGYRAGWKIAKISGTAAEVTRHRERVKGEVKHIRLFSKDDAVDVPDEVRIDLVVEPDEWRAAINGKVFASKREPTGDAFVAPTLQQETSAVSGDVTCRFDNWTVRAPS